MLCVHKMKWCPNFPHFKILNMLVCIPSTASASCFKTAGAKYTRGWERGLFLSLPPLQPPGHAGSIRRNLMKLTQPVEHTRKRWHSKHSWNKITYMHDNLRLSTPPLLLWLFDCSRSAEGGGGSPWARRGLAHRMKQMGGQKAERDREWVGHLLPSPPAAQSSHLTTWLSRSFVHMLSAWLLSVAVFGAKKSLFGFPCMIPCKKACLSSCIYL